MWSNGRLACFYWTLLGRDNCEQVAAGGFADSLLDGVPVDPGPSCDGRGENDRGAASAANAHPVGAVVAKLEALGKDYAALVQFVREHGRGSLCRRISAKVHERWSARYLCALCEAIATHLLRPYEEHLHAVFAPLSQSPGTLGYVTGILRLWSSLAYDYASQMRHAAELCAQIAASRPPGAQLIAFVLANGHAQQTYCMWLHACLGRLHRVLRADVLHSLTCGGVDWADRFGECFVRRRCATATIDYLGPLDNFELRPAVLPPYIHVASAHMLLSVASAAAAMFGGAQSSLRAHSSDVELSARRRRIAAALDTLLRLDQCAGRAAWLLIDAARFDEFAAGERHIMDRLLWQHCCGTLQREPRPSPRPISPMEELGIVRDCALLCDDRLSSAFLRRAAHILDERCTITPATVDAISRCFHAAVDETCASGLVAHRLRAAFAVAVRTQPPATGLHRAIEYCLGEPEPSASAVSSHRPIDCIHFTFSPSPHTATLYQLDVADKLSPLFGLLLRAKMAADGLRSLWLVEMRHYAFRAGVSSADRWLAWHLRAQLWHIVACMRAYLHRHVIDNSMRGLFATLSTCAGHETARRAIGTAVDRMLSQCALTGGHKAPLIAIINRLLALAAAFCRHVRTYVSSCGGQCDTAGYSHACAALSSRLRAIQSRLHTARLLLVDMLKSGQGVQRVDGDTCATLLMFMDFSGFYDRDSGGKAVVCDGED